MPTLDEKILDTAQQIDTLKQDPKALVAVMPMAGKLSPERLLAVLDSNSLFEGKTPAEVAKLIQTDDNAHSVLMKLLAQAIDQGAQEEMDLEATKEMKAKHEATEMPDES